MVEFRCSRTSEDMTPVIRDIDIARFAERVLYDYRPELLMYTDTSLDADPYLQPSLLDPYDFAENYLDATIDVQAIYTDNSKELIAGAAIFDEMLVKVFDKHNMCTRDIVVPANTILLDSNIVDSYRYENFEKFTVMHEAGHLMMHQQVYRRSAALCKRSNIGHEQGRLITSEDFREHQVNTFAGSMFMPPRLFIPYVQNLMQGSRTRFDDEIMVTRTVNDGSSVYWRYREIVRRTARRFGVSSRAAEVQMTRYGLQADNTDNDIYEARRRLKMYKSLWS